MAANVRTIKLQSNEGDIFDVDIALLEQSGLLKDFSESKKNKSRMINYFNLFVLILISEWRMCHSTEEYQFNYFEKSKLCLLSQH